MKKIKSWTVVFIDEFGEEGIGILLPGCTIRGVIADEIEKNIIIEIKDVDMANMIVTSAQNEQYLLLDASRDYLKDIIKCVEIGLKERDGEER